MDWRRAVFSSMFVGHFPSLQAVSLTNDTESCSRNTLQLAIYIFFPRVGNMLYTDEEI